MWCCSAEARCRAAGAEGGAEADDGDVVGAGAAGAVGADDVGVLARNEGVGEEWEGQEGGKNEDWLEEIHGWKRTVEGSCGDEG